MSAHQQISNLFVVILTLIISVWTCHIYVGVVVVVVVVVVLRASGNVPYHFI